MVRRADGDQPGHALAAEAAHIGTRDQTAHAVCEQHDALGTGLCPDLLDPRVELPGEPLDIGERRTVVHRVDGCDSIACQEATHEDPHAVINEHTMNENDGPLRRRGHRIVYQQPVQHHQWP